ncbi:unnamed protein product, partial [Effrenium voratum]
QDTFVELGPVDLEEDEPDRATEDLRFRPRNSAAAEVTFDLPDVLPDLGHVAHIVWREGDTNETDRPAWDAAPSDLARRAMAKPTPKPTTRPPPPRPSLLPSVPPPVAPVAPVAP